MNIKDFLLDNYIYILIVIGLIIITIIGFLADKKGKNKSGNGELLPNNNINSNSNIANQQMQQQSQPMNYQPMGNDMSNQANNNMLQNNVSPINNSINQVSNFGVNPVVTNSFDVNNNQVTAPNFNQSQISDNNLNVLPSSMQGTIVSVNTNMPTGINEPIVNSVIPQSVEPINNVPVEPMYQPLSEQKPVLAPVDPNVNIQNFNQNTLNNSVNPVNESVVPNVIYTATNAIPNSMDVPSSIPSYNMGGNVNNSMMAAPIPTPVNPVSPVTPIPPVPTPPTNPTPVTNIPSTGTVPSPAPISNGQVSFVYGNQQSTQNINNSNMQ